MKKLIGTIPDNESGFISKFRRHQGWWRSFVLNEEEGQYFTKKEGMKKVCNLITNGEKTQKNFLSPEIVKAVKDSLKEQEKSGSGIMERDRLYNNLLSSQPLAFNFFGFLKYHKDIALAFLKTYNAQLTSVEDVVFEYAPSSSNDKSAFDIGFIVKAGRHKGFIGLECKYTDTFSYQRSRSKIFYGDKKDKNFTNYHKLFLDNPDRFPDDYLSYVRNKHFNQLFRNEILGVQLLSDYDFVMTGLFCHPDDVNTINAGFEFQHKIGNQIDNFILITYADYFERIQKLDLSWEIRELVMMLWARYCGLGLSKSIINEKVKNKLFI